MGKRKAPEYDKLKARLDELKDTFKYGGTLELEWLPGEQRIEKIGGTKYFLQGEVKDNTIMIYTNSLEEAMTVLLHEFIEHVIKTEFSEPYILLTNMLSQAYDDVAYLRQEKIINALTTLLSKLPRKKKLIKLGLIKKCQDTQK